MVEALCLTALSAGLSNRPSKHLTNVHLWHFSNNLFTFKNMFEINFKNKSSTLKNIHNQGLSSCLEEVQKKVISDRQQHSEMDVGRERSTWGEYLHSLTVREYP